MARVHVIAEDDSVRRAFVRLLQSAGHEVEGFRTSDLHVALALSLNPACTVLDVSPAATNGLEIQRTIVAARPQLPIIFIAPHGQDALRREALALGARDVLFKPLDGDELIAAVLRALPRPSPPAAASS